MRAAVRDVHARGVQVEGHASERAHRVENEERAFLSDEEVCEKAFGTRNAHLHSAPGPDATYTCAISRANYQAWLVWNPNQTINYPLPPGARQSQDLNGVLTDLSGKTAVSVGMSPILIERF